MVDKVMDAWKYCSEGVWNDTRRTFGVKLIKILNLSVSSFFDRGLQIKSMALTYSTVLSIVPALALLVAIGRGFGLQDSVQNELYILFPSQHQVISTFLKFVDSYLTRATQGVFVGVGLIVLLWTLISLLSSIEDAFNNIWDVRRQRTIFRKFTDYITICLMVPVLLICSSGVSLFMSTTIQDVLYFPFLTPLVNLALELAPLFLSWLAFSFSYFLIPNTDVSFKYAAISGAIAAIGFYILQWLFLNGQIYVSNYNAIYGSFAFLPLLLVWLQFSWLLLLTGCILTYSLQNVMTYNFLGDANNISIAALHRITVIIMAVVAQRFLKHETPLTRTELAAQYNLPVRLIGKIIAQLKNAGLVSYVSRDDNQLAIAPAREVGDMTVGDIIRSYDSMGDSELSPEFNLIYEPLLTMIDDEAADSYKPYDKLKLADVPIPLPEQIKMLLQSPDPQQK